jgi:hypothetical protein
MPICTEETDPGTRTTTDFNKGSQIRDTDPGKKKMHRFTAEYFCLGEGQNTTDKIRESVKRPVPEVFFWLSWGHIFPSL